MNARADARPIKWSILAVPQRFAADESPGDDWRRVIDLAGAAGESGFDAAYFPEHQGRSDGYPGAPFTLAALAAGRHSALRVGTGISLLPLHNPYLLAEQALAIDTVTEGRLTMLGVGLGNVKSEFSAVGVPHNEMVTRFEAGIEVIQRLWSGETVSASVGSLVLDGARLSAKPWTANLRMGIGAMSEKGVRRAARLGLAWISDPMHSMDVIARLADVYWEHAGAGGEVILGREAWVGESAADVERTWWPHVRRSVWEFSLPTGRLTQEPELAGVSTIDDLKFGYFKPRFMTGTADEVIDQCEAAAARVGAGEVSLRFGFAAGPPHEQLRASVQRLGEAIRAARATA